MKSSIKIASLNVRTLDTNNRDSSANFHRFLKRSRLDVLALQETNIDPSDTVQLTRLNANLHVHSACWTKHCGLLLLNANLYFSSIYTTLDQRAIVATICSKDSDAVLFDICTVYAPSGTKLPRDNMLLNLLSLPFFTEPNPKSILLGDLNYHHHIKATAPRPWKSWISEKMVDVLTPDNTTPLPTFNNGRHKTTIDYIFVSTALADQATAPSHSYVSNSWTDHVMVSFELRVSEAESGPGVWRMNVSAMKDPNFNKFITNLLDNALESCADQPDHVAWDNIKRLLQTELQNDGKRRALEFKAKATRLQKAWEHIQTRIRWTKGAPLPSEDKLANLEMQRESVEKDLARSQETIMTRLALRSQTRWRELGERCTRYFFRVLQARASKRTLTEILDPSTDSLVTAPEDLCRVGRSFYTKLYSPDPVDQSAITQLLSTLPESARIAEEDKATLLAEIDLEELQSVLLKTPKDRSPGMDGFPFELYDFLLTHDKLSALLCRIMNAALQRAEIPTSWQQTCMILLYKKGSAAELGNWRPLSLINTDAKLFTKIITLRLQRHLDTLVSPIQTGFAPGRLIADNGTAMQAFLEHCNRTKTKGAGILFDQEKAYDRVHPDYLRAVMTKMNIPSQLVKSICSLFFETHVNLNMNGFLAEPFIQHRGLRQGDPLSPLLFNLAFEPLLQAILACPDIKGFQMNTTPLAPPLKDMAYADDLGAFVKTAAEWKALKEIMETYSKASNARLNLQKTVAFSLHGEMYPDLRRTLQEDQVRIHTEDAEHALEYLGYPIALSTSQRNAFFDTILVNIKRNIGLLMGRQLSVLGRSNIANSLLLSKLWHVVSVHHPTKSWILRAQGAIRKFVVPFNPAPSWKALCRPRSEGGLGLIDITTQCRAFQLRRIQRLCSTNTSFLGPIVMDMVQGYTENSPLAAFWQPQVPLSAPTGRRPLRDRTIVHGLVKAMTCLAEAVVPEFTETTPLGTILATSSKHWILAGRAPVPSIPEWTMHSLFRIKDGRLQIIPTQEREQGFRNHPGLATHIEQGYLRLHPTLDRFIAGTDNIQVEKHMEDFALRINAIKISPGPVVDDDQGTFAKATTRQLRSYILARETPLNVAAPPRFPKKFWSSFWKTEMLHKARNVWWRLLVGKLPTGVRLNPIFPDISTQCRLCLLQPEDDTHFLFACPKKLAIWKPALSKFLSAQDWTPAMVERLLYPNPPVYQPIINLSAVLVLSAILSMIWRFHWKAIIDEEDFESDIVLRAIDREINYLLAQMAEKKRLQDKKLPPTPPTIPPPEPP